MTLRNDILMADASLGFEFVKKMVMTVICPYYCFVFSL